jgi:deoxyribodipyrimidine photolyase-related protein
LAKTLLIFPHQLFADHPGINAEISRIALIEDSLFFGDWHYPTRIHKQKIWLHRASMKRFASNLTAQSISVEYCEYNDQPNALERQLDRLFQPGDEFVVVDPVDFILAKRLRRFGVKRKLPIHFLPTPGFINSVEDNQDYRKGKKRWFMADFYKSQRRRLNLLMDGDEPVGGKWSFDEENRKKIPKKLLNEVPSAPKTTFDDFDFEAKDYVEKRFPNNHGSIENLYYPTSHHSASKWLDSFLKTRIQRFGDYEDAILENESWLWHSVLTPMLNIGLLTPNQVVKRTLKFAESNEIPLNSLEGFLRQIVGWREFIRATYEDLGVTMRSSNHWSHHRKIPDSFYQGKTGIEPLDNTIQRILETGYCHHIERLMVLGGFMFLCEFDPEEIYYWFMDLFIDSYDWVMVPNVFAMSQNADGGLITTKPYFSGSAYIKKMSHYKKGDWCEIWDGLYWRWIWNHAELLSKNPRWAMMCSMAKKMDPEKRESHLRVAEQFLAKLDGHES